MAAPAMSDQAGGVDTINQYFIRSSQLGIGFTESINMQQLKVHAVRLCSF
jgi:hypothetical protein